MSWRKEHPEQWQAIYKRSYKKRREKILAYSKEYGQREKLLCFSYYGTVCQCCGETDSKFLTIDHINNDGAEARQKGEGTGRRLYSKLKRLGYPPGYQVLCFNCNQAKAYFGTCPHKTPLW